MLRRTVVQWIINRRDAVLMQLEYIRIVHVLGVQVVDHPTNLEVAWAAIAEMLTTAATNAVAMVVNWSGVTEANMATL